MSGAKSDEDPTWHLMLYGVALFALGWLIWHIFRTELLEIVRYLRLAELWFINLFERSQQYQSCINWLRYADVGNTVSNTETYGWAALCFGSANLAGLGPEQAVLYDSITPTSMGIIAQLTAPYTRFPVLLFCFGLAIHAVFYSKRNKFRTRYDLEGLIKVQAKVWPVISPIINFKPAEVSARSPGDVVPDKLPLFAEALSPEEWLAFHRIPVANGIPDRDALRRAFQSQLGPRWHGDISGLPLHLLALFAAFALKGGQKREESDELLGEIARCWTADHGLAMDAKLVAKIRKIANDPNFGGKALAVANKFAYRNTALLGVLKWARMMGGVLAPGQFVWLRGQDRAVWYPLNNLGRRAFHSEGAGAMAHYMTEASAQKPLPMPRVDTAIVTMNQYLAQNAVKIPPREEPKGGKSLVKV